MARTQLSSAQDFKLQRSHTGNASGHFNTQEITVPVVVLCTSMALRFTVDNTTFTTQLVPLDGFQALLS